MVSVAQHQLALEHEQASVPAIRAAEAQSLIHEAVLGTLLPVSSMCQYRTSALGLLHVPTARAPIRLHAPHQLTDGAPARVP